MGMFLVERPRGDIRNIRKEEQGPHLALANGGA
jgi:hypothetical protein